MNCDAEISNDIKDPLPKNTHFALFCGRPGSGKTSLAVDMLTDPDKYNRKFTAVHVVAPENSIHSLAKDVFKGHKRMYDTLDADVLEHIMMESEEMASDGKFSLLMIDDFASELKRKDIMALINRIVIRRRHMRLSVWIMTQSLRMVPAPVRKVISHIYMWKPPNNLETQVLYQEMFFVDKKTGADLIRFVFKEDPIHTFMMIDCQQNKAYKNFDEVAWGDEEEEIMLI